jgi:hypothetical protein
MKKLRQLDFSQLATATTTVEVQPNKKGGA